MDTLEATTNPFGGILPRPDTLPADPDQFGKQLRHSLESWKAEGHKVVWLEVTLEKAGLIPVAVGSGFVFHHTTNEYLMLTLRLVEGSFIPPFSTHYIGAGGVVLNPQDELLVVSEKHRRRRNNPSYKLPGGAVHPGEHISECVKREVMEETGVETKFKSLVCFRHWHGYRYGKSDIYFVCRLSPVNQEITIQEEELEECLWMPVQDYLGNDHVSVFNKEIVQAALDSPGVAPTAIEGYSDPEKHEIFMPPSLKQA